MNSPIDLSDERSFDDVLIVKEQEIAQVLDSLSEVKSWIDDNLRQPKDDDGETEKKSTLSIPCFIKQPKQPEVKGVIKQDLGDRFVVDISDELITISKLFVYPDFEQCSSKIITPSTVKQHQDKNCSSKTRRQKGEGSGHIYYRTVIRNGKNYQQAYYQWRENGQQRTKYIPKKLLSKVQKAELFKKPVTEILELLLGGLEKCSSKKFDTLSNVEVLTKDKSVETINNCSSKITSPPSKRKKRSSGYGGGYIEYREVKRNHKTYSQYWYH
jgi:hypothetical protein